MAVIIRKWNEDDILSLVKHANNINLLSEELELFLTQMFMYCLPKLVIGLEKIFGVKV